MPALFVLLLGCATPGYIQEPYACEFDVVDWWEGDPAWLLLGAQESANGSWQFDAPSSYAATDHTEGFWDPAAGRFSYTAWATDPSPQVRVDVAATGSIGKDGDLDLEETLFSYDDFGFLLSWTESVRRDACAVQRTAKLDGTDDTNVYTYTAVDDDTIEGTYAFTPEGGGVGWDETSTLTSDLVETADGGLGDGSYVEQRESRPSGDSDVHWQDHRYADSGWESIGDETYDLEGTRHATTQEAYLGALVRECEITESYAGVGTASCYEPEDGRTCALSWDPDTCTSECDDGTVSAC